MDSACFSLGGLQSSLRHFVGARNCSPVLGRQKRVPCNDGRGLRRCYCGRVGLDSVLMSVVNNHFNSRSGVRARSVSGLRLGATVSSKGRICVFVSGDMRGRFQACREGGRGGRVMCTSISSEGVFSFVRRVRDLPLGGAVSAFRADDSVASCLGLR